MFGYVLPSRARLTEEGKTVFQTTYCGLCRTMREKYGFFASLTLNYDFTFLALLLSGAGKTETCRRRCIAHPCHGCDAAVTSPALERSAAYGVILAYWQTRDKIADGRGFSRIKARVAARCLAGAYRRAARDEADFDRMTREQLARLADAERRKTPSLDEPADAFASLLAAVSASVADESERRVFRELFYHLGRWIYLVDAADDLEEDMRTGNYNPLLYRFSLTEPHLTGQTREEFAATLALSVRAMASAFELLSFGDASEVLRSTFYEGLYQVGDAVLSGTFRVQKRKSLLRGREV